MNESFSRNTNVVSMTTNYEIFKFWKNNRDAVRYDKLVKSIQANDLTSACPILVNRNFYIIDGQNRFLACKKLGKPIYYLVKDIADNQIDNYIITLNTASTNWHLPDYLSYYIKKGYINYIDLREFMDKHGLRSTHIGQAFVMFADGMGGGAMTKIIRNGLLGKNWDKADEFASLVMSLPIKQYLQRSFIEAYKVAYKTYPADKFAKLNRRIQKLQHFASQGDYLTAFENIVSRKSF